MSYDAILAALSDPMRREIFGRLRNDPSSVAALAEGLPISRPAVSQHLKILKEAGLVADQAQGARRVYRMNRDGLAALQAWLDGFRGDPPDTYQDEIQRQIDERRYT